MISYFKSKFRYGLFIVVILIFYSIYRSTWAFGEVENFPGHQNLQQEQIQPDLLFPYFSSIQFLFETPSNSSLSKFFFVNDTDSSMLVSGSTIVIFAMLKL